MKIRKRHLNLANLKELRRRQEKPAFGKSYKPAQLVSKNEAPSMSRATAIESLRHGRTIHTHSSNERAATLVALYIPEQVDLHEQKLLSPTPCRHPLTGFPGVVDVGLPASPGTLYVAEQLGYLSLHPTVKDTVLDEDGMQKSYPVPFPYIGDLLLYLCDQLGVYCVNWTVKEDEEDFTHPNWQKRSSTSRSESYLIRKETARHEIESAYYSAMKIRTEHIVHKSFQAVVISNLELLHRFVAKQIVFADDVYEDMLRAYLVGMVNQVVPVDTIQRLALRHRRTIIDCMAVLYRAIWHRQLRVDLYHPIVPDKVLRPETKDFLDEIRHLYRR